MKEILFQYRSRLKLLTDIVLWSSATIMAFLLRLDGDLGRFAPLAWQLFVVLSVVKAGLVVFMGSHRQSWRNTGFTDIFQVFTMVALLFLPYLVITVLTRGVVGIPLSIPFLEFLLAISLLVGVRGLTRFILKYRIPVHEEPFGRRRVLIAGAGESGTMVAREMLKNREARLQPVAFIDDDPTKQNQRFMGIPVAGRLSDLAEVAASHDIDEILIAMPSETGEVVRKLVQEARETRADFRIIPSMYDLLSGKVVTDEIRKLDLEDLLKRDPVRLDAGRIRDGIAGKRILVTGAGGSIGSEMVRQLSEFEPACLILLDRSENSLHELELELSRKAPELNRKKVIGDIGDRLFLERLFRQERPGQIFHAAAYKHVPLMEAQPSQAIMNNVAGTRLLVEESLENGVELFVNISTDKAVNPASVMGATKRLAERLVQDASRRAEGERSFVSVRFGNVLGSRGSVVPLFKEQIRNKGPVTVTHPGMTRYFMTLKEAAGLVLQAGTMGQNGVIFLLDMGEPVLIDQMARDLITLSGFEPGVDIPISYTGIRPGEKLHEELIGADETTETTSHPKIRAIRQDCNPSDTGDPDFQENLEQLISAARKEDLQTMRKVLRDLLPEYSDEPRDSDEPR